MDDKKKEPTAVVSPSMLPRLEECRCFIHDGIPNEAMRRGTAIDAAIRHALQPRGFTPTDQKWMAEHPDDITPIMWGIKTIQSLSKGGVIVTDEKSLKPASFCPEQVKTGIMDSACYPERWTVEIKTGEQTDYDAQAASYAANCLSVERSKEGSQETDESTWKTYILFVDHQEIVEHDWTWPEASKKVLDIVNKPMVPAVNPHCTWCGHRGVCFAKREADKEKSK